MTNLFTLCTTSGMAFARRFCGCFLILLPLFLPEISHAAPSVTAGYQKASGSQLVVEISTGSPAPSSLILVQHLPVGVKLLDATPPANNVNSGKGEAKWLLRDLKPGTRIIRMTLDREVTTDQIAGEIRYKSLQGGGMLTLPIDKP